MTFGEGPKDFKLTYDNGRYHCVLEGVDISRHVQSVAVDAEPRALPVVSIELSPRGESVLFSGLAHVQVGEPVDPGPAAAEFLDAIDPKLLEEAALNREDLSNDRHGLTSAMLRQLSEWARGQS